MPTDTIRWLLESNEPWTQYRTRVDLLDQAEDHPDVRATRARMVSHPKIQNLIQQARSWPGYPIKRHNDAKHPLYMISTLADFGMKKDDPGIELIIDNIIEQQATEGAFQIQINIPKAFGGSGEDAWAWILCDTPTILYSLLAYGCGEYPNVIKAVGHISTLSFANGWHCTAASELGRFRGPGKKDDPCPIANVYVLKALAHASAMEDTTEAKRGIDALLSHWEKQAERKMFLFGIGTDFRKLKYPFVWYDILHVVDVLSQYDYAQNDPRLQEMLLAITSQENDDGLYTANSMYRAWKDWSFANKKEPSPWLTFLVLRIKKRMGILPD